MSAFSQYVCLLVNLTLKASLAYKSWEPALLDYSTLRTFWTQGLKLHDLYGKWQEVQTMGPAPSTCRIQRCSKRGPFCWTNGSCFQVNCRPLLWRDSLLTLLPPLLHFLQYSAFLIPLSSEAQSFACSSLLWLQEDLRGACSSSTESTENCCYEPGLHSRNETTTSGSWLLNGLKCSYFPFLRGTCIDEKGKWVLLYRVHCFGLTCWLLNTKVEEVSLLIGIRILMTQSTWYQAFIFRTNLSLMVFQVIISC